MDMGDEKAKKKIKKGSLELNLKIDHFEKKFNQSCT